jgi:hypothetical protein
MLPCVNLIRFHPKSRIKFLEPFAERLIAFATITFDAAIDGIALRVASPERQWIHMIAIDVRSEGGPIRFPIVGFCYPSTAV